MLNKKLIVSCLILIITLVGACRSEEKIKHLPTVDIKIKDAVFKIEIAKTDEEKATGLMYRSALSENAGMLFVYERDERLYFYMKNTSLPLSLAFISAQGEILQIEDLIPFSESIVPSRLPVRYALEVKQGVYKKLGINIGDKVIFPPDFF